MGDASQRAQARWGLARQQREGQRALASCAPAERRAISNKLFGAEARKAKRLYKKRLAAQSTD
jgi:hypothetical protein